MSIPAVATRLSTPHWRLISLIYFPSFISVMICWTIGRMIASILIECAVCAWDQFFSPWSFLFGLVGLAPKGYDSSTVAHRSCTISAHDRTRSYPMHCTLRRRYFGRIVIGKIPCDDVVKCCTLHIIKWCNTHQIFACVCLRSNQWSSCSLNNSWNWLSTFSKWDFVEMKYPVRNVAAFMSPPMILRRPSDLFISA